jgi:hypothetical protein
MANRLEKAAADSCAQLEKVSLLLSFALIQPTMKLKEVSRTQNREMN